MNSESSLHQIELLLTQVQLDIQKEEADHLMHPKTVQRLRELGLLLEHLADQVESTKENEYSDLDEEEEWSSSDSE